MGRKKCCVCGGTKKKNFFKAPSLENLKSVFNDVYDINEESSICGGCKRRFHKLEERDTEVSLKYSSAGTILKPVGTK